mmetsp:Transcript_5195/g.19017  ORF Transcript_5195/g.19017 Transcript_5195/m.19017 type:complete len:599 (-) Transcript_5195:974-2770(-)
MSGVPTSARVHRRGAHAQPGARSGGAAVGRSAASPSRQVAQGLRPQAHGDAAARRGRLSAVAPAWAPRRAVPAPSGSRALRRRARHVAYSSSASASALSESDDSEGKRTAAVETGRPPEDVFTYLQLRLMLRIVTLGFPVLLSNLVDPTVSCVELMYAGVLGTLAIAAFAPIGSFMDAQTEVIAALGTATTKVVSGATGTAEQQPASTSSQEELRATRAKARQQAQRQMAYTSFPLCISFGVLLAALVFLFPGAVSYAVGIREGAEPAMAAMVVEYIKLRALGSPLWCFNFSAEGFLIGLQNTRTPFLVFLLGGVVNVSIITAFFLLKPSFGMIGMAYGSLISQALMSLVFYWCLRRDYGLFAPHKGKNKKNNKHKNTTNSSSVRLLEGDRLAGEGDAPVDATASGERMIASSTEGRPPRKRYSREFKHSRKDGLRFLWFPDMQDERVQDFVKVAASVAAAALWRMVTYAGATSVVAANLPTTAVATHKVVYEIYFTCSFLSETVFVAGASMVPNATSRSIGEGRRVARSIVNVSFLLGGLLLIPMTLLMHSTLFTSDPEVIALMRTILPNVSCMLLVSCVVYGVEGICIGLGKVRLL